MTPKHFLFLAETAEAFSRLFLRFRTGELLFALLALTAVVCPAKQFQVRGFVTQIISPTTFQVDDVTVTRDQASKLEANRKLDDALDATASLEIRVGSDVEVKGDLDESKRELKAKSIKIFLEDPKPIKRTALLDKGPDLQKTDKGWRGSLFAAGQRITVSDATTLAVIPSKAEREKLATQKKPVTPIPVAGPDVLNLDAFMLYEGTRQKDGTILATKVLVQNPEIEPSEEKMLKRLTPKVKEPDYKVSRPGELKVGGDSYKIVANKESQEYVSNLGRKVIPQNQNQLPDSSPAKIPFRFYLVEKADPLIHAYPNGIVVVSSKSFDVYDNEAQLAYVLAREIAQVLAKRDWRVEQFHKKSFMALRIGSAAFGLSGLPVSLLMMDLTSGYMMLFDDQADCAALQQMLAAGYDLRDAPKSWKAYEKKHSEKEFYPLSQRSVGTIRTSFLMSELRNNYSDVDFSTLINNTMNYQRITGLVRKLMYSEKNQSAGPHP